jgi:hypothetical protein
MLRTFLILPAVVALALAQPLPAVAELDSVDSGSFVVYQRDRAIGAEIFSLEGRGDSLNVFARSWQKVDVGRGAEEMEKQMALVVDRQDYGLRLYQSNFRYRGKELIRGVVMGDTAFSVYREMDGHGEGDRLLAPPGRMYVLDAQLFTLFDLICISLHGQTFERRPISMLTLGARDTVVEATAISLGTEAIRWGSRPVQARKLSISDGTTTFVVWAGPAGKMLRLEHPETGMRVVRDAPNVKRREGVPKPGG